MGQLLSPYATDSKEQGQKDRQTLYPVSGTADLSQYPGTPLPCCDDTGPLLLLKKEDTNILVPTLSINPQ